MFKRSDFPLLAARKLIYLDSAATSLKPRPVIDAVLRYYEEESGTVHRALYELSLAATTKYAQARMTAQRFLNAASADEIIFTRGTTQAINLVARSFGKAFVSAGDEIIISEMEHHSNIVPWQMLCQEKGAILKVIAVTEAGEIDLQQYQSLLSSRTKLVSVVHISNVLGTHNPVEQIISLAHEKGAFVLIDGAQSAPHLEIDVQKMDADFFVFSGHKIYGPTGIGILYGKKELLEKMPPYEGGGDMVENVTFEKTTYQPPPLKFEAGTPMIASVLGLGAALEYVMKARDDKSFLHEIALITHMEKLLSQIPGVKILGQPKKRGALISFAVEGAHPLDLGTLLDVRGIAIRTGHLCAQPILRCFGYDAVLRASVAPYNTLEEIESFASALQDVIHLLKKSSAS